MVLILFDVQIVKKKTCWYHLRSTSGLWNKRKKRRSKERRTEWNDSKEKIGKDFWWVNLCGSNSTHCFEFKKIVWIAASTISEKLFSVSGTGIELFELTEEDLIWVNILNEAVPDFETTTVLYTRCIAAYKNNSHGIQCSFSWGVCL